MSLAHGRLHAALPPLLGRARRRHAPCEEGRGVRLLLRERHRAGHPGAPARAPAVRPAECAGEADFQELCSTARTCRHHTASFHTPTYSVACASRPHWAPAQGAVRGHRHPPRRRRRGGLLPDRPVRVITSRLAAHSYVTFQRVCLHRCIPSLRTVNSLRNNALDVCAAHAVKETFFPPPSRHQARHSLSRASICMPLQCGFKTAL